MIDKLHVNNKTTQIPMVLRELAPVTNTVCVYHVTNRLHTI